MFFVVSGFLITTLLHREWLARGHLDLRRFWVRRARRLLPALVLVVVVSTGLGWLVGDDLLVNIDRQTLGVLTFSNNWVEISAGSSYFAHTSPLLFMNFWSLAVEEQFYLLWPLVFLALVTAVRNPRWRVWLVLGAAAASALAMAALVARGAATTRVYYGTDTHLFGLMIGAALALAHTQQGSVLHSRAWRRVCVPVGAAALLGLVALALVLAQDSAVTFRGGIVAASALTALVIAGVLGGEGVLRQGLRLPVLEWVGQRSYGIYLWHWPMILVVTAALPPTLEDSPLSWLGRLVALVLTLVLAALSYRWLELPVRQRGFRGAGRSFAAALRRPADPLPRTSAAVAVGLVAVSAFAVVTAPDKSQVQRDIEANTALVEGSLAEPGPPAAAPAAPGPPGLVADAHTAVGPAFAMPTGPEITAFGDSLVVTTARGLIDRFPGIMIDAKSNRQWPAGEEAVQARLAEGTVRRAVLIDFGTNAGVQDPELVRRVLASLGPSRMIVLVNLFGSWEEHNPILAEVAAGFPNVVVADWHAAISARPDLLQADGVHPGIVGSRLYADVVKDAFHRLSTR